MTTAARTPSPFDTLERAFRLLSTGPAPLALPAPALGRRADAPLPLDQLRAVLLHPSTPHAARDQALSALLGRAQAEGGRWTVGLAGVLVFGLRAAVAPLCAVCPGRRDDVEAEALAGLVEAIAATSPSRRGLAARLIWLSRNRAKALVRRELGDQARTERRAVACPPPKPYGHPDLVLAHAVAEGVLCAADAALVGDTRLGLSSPADAARALGIGDGGRLQAPPASRGSARQLAGQRRLRAGVCPKPAPMPLFPWCGSSPAGPGH